MATEISIQVNKDDSKSVREALRIIAADWDPMKTWGIEGGDNGTGMKFRAGASLNLDWEE